MGLEAACTIRVGRRRGEGKAHLESDALRVRGDVRLDVPLASLQRPRVEGDELVVATPDGELRLGLGKRAAHWARRIQEPRSVLDKLEVKPDTRVALVDVDEPLAAEIAARAGEVSHGRARTGTQRAFVGVRDARGLAARLARIVPALDQKGAVWVLYPKTGGDALFEEIRDAAAASDLVDTKYCAASSETAALKLARRKTGRAAIPAASERRAVRGAARATRTSSRPKAAADGAMQFDGVVAPMGPSGAWASVALPAWVSTALGRRGTVPVAGTINGFAFRSSAHPDGDGGHSIMVNKAMRDGARIATGARAAFTLSADDAPRRHEWPADVAKALGAKARAAFEKLSPSHQKEYVQHVLEAKRPETRERRIARVRAMLETPKPSRL